MTPTLFYKVVRSSPVTTLVILRVQSVLPEHKVYSKVLNSIHYTPLLCAFNSYFNSNSLLNILIVLSCEPVATYLSLTEIVIQLISLTCANTDLRAI